MQGERDELGDARLVVGDEHKRLTVQMADPPWASRVRATGQFSALQGLSNTLQLQWLLQFPEAQTDENAVRRQPSHVPGVPLAL
jgi:hypothetical protein